MSHSANTGALAVVLLVLSADYAAGGFISNTGKARRLYNPRYPVQQNGDGIEFFRHRRALRKSRGKSKKSTKNSGPVYLSNARDIHETLIKTCKGSFTAADEGKCCGYDVNKSPIITCEKFPRARVFKKCDGSFQCCEGVTGACAGKRENSTCHSFRTKHTHNTEPFFLGFTEGVCIKSGCGSYCDTALQGGPEDVVFWLLITAAILVAVAVLVVFYLRQQGLFCFKNSEKSKIAQAPDKEAKQQRLVQVQAQPVVVEAQPVAVSQSQPVAGAVANPV